MAGALVRVKQTVVTRVTEKHVTTEVTFRFSARVRRSCGTDPGISRTRIPGGFRYTRANGRVVRDRATLARIAALAIPPAWKRVWICPFANGHLQATGWDARGRKQYRYHPSFRARQEGAKFDRLAAFGHTLPRLRARVAADLKRPRLPLDKVLAAVVRLLDRSHLRIGNPEYRRANRSFGIATLLDKHVSFPPSGVRVSFKGKSGVRHDRTVSDKRLAAVVRQCRDVPGQHLFQYRDEDGTAHAVGSTEVNDYIRRAAGGEFTTKDFRTWAGTVAAARRLAAEDRPESEKAAARTVARVIREVAQALGNTPAVCRKSYVHPRVVEAFAARQLTRNGGRSSRGMSKPESHVLRVLRA